MFLLRRRADGRFYINRHLSNYRRDPVTRIYERITPEYWVEDPSICKPFFRRSDAMQSKGAQLECPFPPVDWRNSTVEQRAMATLMRHDWFRDKVGRRAERDELFEIVEMEYRIKEEVNG
jgi:hypothetical protein